MTPFRSRNHSGISVEIQRRSPRATSDVAFAPGRTPGRSARLLAIAGCLVLMTIGCSEHEPAAERGRVDAEPAAVVLAADRPATPATAAVLYARHCAICHGADGKGAGPAAHLVYPPPRDFTAGVYRFKSTPGGQLPTPADLRRVIKEGIDRTAMPSFAGVFSDDQIDALGRFVLAMQNAQPVDAPRQAVAVPEAPKFTADFVAAGKAIYLTGGCAACHGEGGRGDGPAAATLRDGDGWLLPPADFTTGLYKAGRTPDALYRVIHLGVPGTPMPGFGDAIKQGFKVDGVGPNVDMTWAMVAYLASLVESKPQLGVASGANIVVAPAQAAAMLTEPRHDAWSQIKPVNVSVRPIWQRRAYTPSVAVRAVTHEGQVAIALEWSDAQTDFHGDSVHQFTDAAAVMFSLTDDPPALSMGQRNGADAQAPPDLVNVWHWRADRQLNADTNQLFDTVGDKAVAGSNADLYMFKKGDLTAGPITEHDKTYLPAWGVGNPKADPALLRRPILESNAAGFGSLTLQPVDQQSVSGKGVWVDGKWRVVMVRTIASQETGDVRMSDRPQGLPLAFAVWQGAAGDRDGVKLYSGWHRLKLK